jgi:hypothetical protein
LRLYTKAAGVSGAGDGGGGGGGGGRGGGGGVSLGGSGFISSNVATGPVAALALADEMEVAGFKHTSYTLTCALLACAQLRDYSQARPPDSDCSPRGAMAYIVPVSA